MVDAMKTLYVRGLDDEGPGDIVGAFVNDAGVDPDAIGEISIDGDTATVDVDDGVAEDVIVELDGGRIGHSAVTITEVDAETQRVLEYVDEYRQLVELEREEEMRRHEQEIKHLSGQEREAKGRALLHMNGRDEGEGLGGHLVKFVRNRSGEELPDTEIAVGDLVMVSKRDPLRDDNPTGTVTQKTNYSITVAFDHEPPGFVYDKGLRVDLYVNDITFQRMQDALDMLSTADGALKRLRDIVVGIDAPSAADPVDIDDWHNPELNASQRDAVRAAIGSDDVHLIHGPPGTGKTTTLIEVIQQCVDRGETVLATAASNTAVDNMLEFLQEQGVDAVRVGHPARVTETLQEHTLDSVIEENETYQRAQEIRDDAFAVLEEQDDLTHPSGRWRRGLADDRIRELAEDGRGSRGVPAEKIQEMAEWLELQDEADDLFDEAERLEDEAVDEIIDGADVVCTTNATAGSELMDGRPFDTVVIDEATQATEPSCLIPITHVDGRVVMAGDHKQLPPTVQNQDAAEQGLRHTLFEKLAELHQPVVSMLTVQYRMHMDIMDFPSAYMYNGALTADEAVRTHTLTDIGVSTDELPADHSAVLRPDQPLVFVDTAELDAAERQREGSTSTENPAEAELVADYVEAYLDAGVDPTDIAVIAPYDDQVDRMEQLLDVAGLEIDTVDGFQGREKAVVIVSLVRSNDWNEIGFLEEERRFNVAATRARQKLIVVGDASTVTAGEIYDAFVDYAQEQDAAVVLDS